MGTWRRRPLVIEAVQWTGDNADELLGWIGDAGHAEGDDIVIHTLEGDLTARVGDWIGRGVEGACHPVRADLFPGLYEPVGGEHVVA